MPKSKRGRRPVKRCSSCKRLKIKVCYFPRLITQFFIFLVQPKLLTCTPQCDQRQPCEYCKDRRKECVYEPEVPTSALSSESPESQETALSGYHPTTDLVLTQTSSQLSMSQQDVELLNFFEQKAKSTVFYNNHVFDDAFKTEVNPLFRHNSAVRYTLLAVSAIIQLNVLLVGSNDGAIVKSNQLLQTGMDYFQKALTFQQNLVSLVENPNNVQDGAIKELLSSCLLQMGYFVVNVGRVMPLLSLDRSQIDLITLLGAHRFIIEKYLPKVANSKIPLLFPSDSVLPSDFDERYYLSDSLRRDLNDVYGESNPEVKAVLEGAIVVIERAIYRTMQYGLPYPLIAMIVQLSNNEFRSYLYQANEFALRILFVCAVLCAMSKFCTRRFDNIYYDYVAWYKEWQFTNRNKFEYLLDDKLYFLALQTDFEPEFSSIGEFNPIEIAKGYESSE